MNEDGESSEEEEQQQTVALVSSRGESPPMNSSTGGGYHAADSSPASPMPSIGAKPRTHPETSGELHGGRQQKTAGDTTMTRASEGAGRPDEAGHRSCLHQEARGSRKRVAKLWSKLRAVAYITSLQVGRDLV